MKRKVLHLIPSFHQGGSERQALQLALRLKDEGSCEISLACLEKDGVLLDESVESSFGNVPDFSLTSFYDAKMVRQLRRFAAYLRQERFEIVQTHDFYTNIFGMLGSRLAGVPMRIAAKRETGMRSGLQLFIERRAFATADVVVVNAEGVRRYLSAGGVPAGKLRLIYNGIDPRPFDAAVSSRGDALRSLGLPDDRPLRFVTIVANLRDRVKNHEMFLRSAARIARIREDIRFAIAGEGERTRLITSEAARLGIAEKCVFLGRCGRVPELLAVSDVCVLTSDSEGFSNSILEYMAAGRPVVATAVGGAGEAIVDNETGFLAAPNDDETLADRIGRVLDDPRLAERMGAAARRRLTECFSIEAQVEKTLALYESGNVRG